MTSYCAFNANKLTPNGNGYAGDSTFPPTSQTLTGGPVGAEVLTFTPTANNVVINFKGGALSTVVVSNSSTAIMNTNTQYIVDSISANLQLPNIGVAAQGDLLRIVNLSGPWVLNKASTAQNINIGSTETSSSGTLSGPGNNEVITMLCVQSGSPERWVSYDVTGNITVS